MIPEIARQTILDELHSTHLSVEYMKAMARNRFFWPGLQEDLHNTFKACRACKREIASKPNTRRYNTVPADLLQMSPAEEISTDFMILWYSVHISYQGQTDRIYSSEALQRQNDKISA